jgi:putative Ca2+/H+ antiporter (TMEM165/GDT1 family)
MDFKLILTTFWLIFLAELGDKTQLATVAFSVGTPSKMSVFAGSALALVLTSALAVLFGDALSRFVPLKALHIAAGGGFMVIGALMLAKELWK